MLELTTQTVLGMNGLRKPDHFQAAGKEFAKIISVRDLLSNASLTIPDYQRPYKWSIKNVNHLIDDILLHQKKTAYRLGTLVVHKEEKLNLLFLNIVDGQQRAITLSLIAHAILEHRKDALLQIKSDGKLAVYKPQLLNSKLHSSISKFNIQSNYHEIVRRVRDFNSDSIHFFFEQCELVQVTLTDISEAFQFFDSQNSRGKDLEPHDLLKAFHLRAMTGVVQDEEKIQKVAGWEDINTNELASLFGNYLFRIRNWSKGYPARYFTKEETDVFKGITVEIDEHFPFAQLFRIGSHFTDDYNNHGHRTVDGHYTNYPFQIDQTIINGKRFFEMVPFYTSQLHSINKTRTGQYRHLNKGEDDLAIEILEVLSTYAGRHRRGDTYVNTLFQCCLLYYINKFGTVYFGRAIEKFFVWSYMLRLTMQSVYIESIDNYARGGLKMFRQIREATHPLHVINISVERLSNEQLTKMGKVSNVEEIKQLFIKMNYFHG